MNDFGHKYRPVKEYNGERILIPIPILCLMYTRSIMPTFTPSLWSTTKSCTLATTDLETSNQLRLLSILQLCEFGVGLGWRLLGQSLKQKKPTTDFKAAAASAFCCDIQRFVVQNFELEMFSGYHPRICVPREV